MMGANLRFAGRVEDGNKQHFNETGVPEPEGRHSIGILVRL
jgi:hypothetical protein